MKGGNSLVTQCNGGVSLVESDEDVMLISSRVASTW